MAGLEDQLNQILSNPGAMEQIMSLAQSLGGNGSPPPSPPPAAQGESLGGLDPGLLLKVLPLVQELGHESNARQLIHALSPYLRPERQEKVDRALQLARLIHLGRQFLTKWEGQDV